MKKNGQMKIKLQKMKLLKIMKYKIIYDKKNRYKTNEVIK